MMEFFKGTVTARDWMAVGAVLAVAVVIVAVFVLFVQKTQHEELAQVIAEDKVVRSDLDTAREKERNIAALREEAEKTQALVEQFEDRLPRGREIPLLVKQFEALANAAEVDVSMASLQRERDMRKETIPYKVEARGTFHQIADFINRLERFRRYLKVSDLELGQEKEGVCEAKFTLSTFRFIQKTSAGTSS